jgi:hypothetical protein
MKKISYWDKTDLEKIRSQWTKLTGLHDRAESSAAIVRAATAAELAATYAVRCEFQARSQLTAAFVNNLLKWANGLIGKFDHLLLPLSSEDEVRHEIFKMLHNQARKINDKRNSIVHRGEFCNPDEAREIIEVTRKFINRLVHTYDRKFSLEKRDS